jgi:outer membrane lipoprotein-sorting protein
MKTRTNRIAAAAILIIAALIGVHYFGGSIESAAYAEVVSRLQNARTLLYKVITPSNTGGGTVEVEFAFKEPGYLRSTTADGFVTIMDGSQGRGMSILPPRRQYIDMEFSNVPDDPASDPFVVVEKLRSLPARADETLGIEQIDGQSVQGYRVIDEDTVTTVWIEPKGKKLVQVEIVFTGAAGMNKTMTDFEFDTVLADSLFSLTPPEGYTPVEVQADASTLGEEDLIEFLRMWSSWTKDGTFPPNISGPELAKISMDMAREGRFTETQTSEQQRSADAVKMYRGMMFVNQLPAASNWRYAGENVKSGDAQTPIFWYRPEGSPTYRVLYGDLSIRDVPPEGIPK